MALYHFHVEQIKRSEGRTAVASAAYRAGEKLYNLWDGETHDYTRKGGVILLEIMLPEYAPERLSDRYTLWNEVEQIEKHYKAQLAYSFDMALQNEFSLEENIALVREFVQKYFVSDGMICDLAVHQADRGDGGIPNPHFHVLVPIRPLNADGTWGAKQHRVYHAGQEQKSESSITHRKRDALGNEEVQEASSGQPSAAYHPSLTQTYVYNTLGRSRSKY